MCTSDGCRDCDRAPVAEVGGILTYNWVTPKARHEVREGVPKKALWRGTEAEIEREFSTVTRVVNEETKPLFNYYSLFARANPSKCVCVWGASKEKCNKQ